MKFKCTSNWSIYETYIVELNPCLSIDCGENAECFPRVDDLTGNAEANCSCVDNYVTYDDQTDAKCNGIYEN